MSYRRIAEVRMVHEETRTRHTARNASVVNELLDEGWIILSIASSPATVYQESYFPASFTYSMGRLRADEAPPHA